MKSILGREEELETLNNILNSKSPEFVAIYGRRRIGKTYLVREAFGSRKGLIFFNVTGTKNGTKKEQIAHFIQKLSEVFYGGVKLQEPKSWSEAFSLLSKAMESQKKSTKIILFFDEIPWMATKKSRLLEMLDYYWNQYWSNNSKIKLIICGSSASWIIHKVIKNKGGLHNRITQKIPLSPFTLSETRKYLLSRGVVLKNSQILMIYMATGGVPYYLSQVKKGLSAAQIIEDLAFSKKGILFDEFEQLFASLFDESEEYVKIIKTIASSRYGISQSELLQTLGDSFMGGTGSKRLQDLEETGFIMKLQSYQHERKGLYYRVVDEYSLFYLKWIEPIKNSLQKRNFKKDYYLTIQNTPEWNAWLGLAFESICYEHISNIRKALNLEGSAIADSWRYVPKKGSSDLGAQIDLLFDRRDDAITLCEIKYGDEPFSISKDYLENLNRKMAVFKNRTGTKKQLFMAMICAGGLKNNLYAQDFISGVVVLDDFFLG